MANLTIYRRDSFLDPFWIYTFEVVRAADDPVDPGGPFDLAGWEIRTTFRPMPVPIEDDPDDTGDDVAVRGLLIVGADGIPSTQERLVLVGDAFEGRFAMQLTSDETGGLPAGTALVSDLQFTFRDWDGNGNDLVRTVPYSDTLSAVDSTTNRLDEPEG